MANIRFTSENADELFITQHNGVVRLTYNYDTPYTCFISTLIISEEFRGHGYGNRLLSLAETDAKEHACDKVLLQVNKYSWLVDWYKRKGYNIIAPGYEESMVIMEKVI